MELIRRDEAIEALVAVFKEKEKGGLLPKEFKKALNSCKTVEAIPINYLQTRADLMLRTNTFGGTFTAHEIDKIIKEWRQE